MTFRIVLEEIREIDKEEYKKVIIAYRFDENSNFPLLVKELIKVIASKI